VNSMDYASSMRTHGGDSVSDIMVGQRLVVRQPLLRERLLAEFLGTFFLVLTVCVSVAGGDSMAAVAIGLVLGVQIYTFGAVSGGFFNPAVTLAVLLSGRQKIQAVHAALYAAAQFLGASIAGFCAFAATGSTFSFDYALTRGWGSSLVLEVLFTMALCSTVLAAGTSNDAPNQYFGFAIGLTVTGGALASGGFDQGSFNPAVTLGANLANYANSGAARNPSFGAWALFLLAPMAGGALAAAVFRGTRQNEYAGLEVVMPPPAQKGSVCVEEAPGTPKSAKSSRQGREGQPVEERV